MGESSARHGRQGRVVLQAKDEAECEHIVGGRAEDRVLADIAPPLPFGTHAPASLQVPLQPDAIGEAIVGLRAKSGVVRRLQIGAIDAEAAVGE